MWTFVPSCREESKRGLIREGHACGDGRLDVTEDWLNRKLTEWPGRDAFSDGLPVMGCIRSVEIIPAEQKSKIEMHLPGVK